MREGRRDRLINLILSGFLCGVLWEVWNYWSRAKWHYTVPIMENLKIFEMPVPGYFGFPAVRARMFHHVCLHPPPVHARRQGDRAVIRHALVLTAGLGTRLRPLTDVRAKPAIPVAGEPIIRRIIAWLVSQGVDDLVLNLHHRPQTLTARVGDGADLGARVRYSWEQPRVLGSAGGPRLARPMLAAGTFLIINGDTLTDVDLVRIADAHAASSALVTLALVPNREFTRYGGVLLDAGHRVAGFARRGPSSEGSYHFIGVQIVNGAVFDAVPPGAPASSIGGVYDA